MRLLSSGVAGFAKFVENRGVLVFSLLLGGAARTLLISSPSSFAGFAALFRNR